MSFLTQASGSIIILVDSACLNTGGTNPDKPELAFTVPVDQVLVELALLSSDAAVSLHHISSLALTG